jgi:hypothetical protein
MSKYFWHSIGTERPGKRPSQESWDFRRDAAIITAGFNDQPEEKGRRVVQKYEIGDIIFIYANGHGAVAAAEITDDAGYYFAATNQSEPGNLSKHRHRRKVRWLCVIERLSDAVPISVFEAPPYDLYHPLQTTQAIKNVSGAESLLQLMKQQFGTPDSRSFSQELSGDQLYPSA